jgi:hypothetical protein
MAKMTDVYGGKYIKATPSGFIGMPGLPDECDAVVLTIAGQLSTTEFDDGRKQRVAAFKETEMTLGLNVTNWNAIAALSGKDDDDDWDGLTIELFVVPEDKSQTGHAIRVRKPRANTYRFGKAKAAAKAPAPTGDGTMGVEMGARIVAALDARGKSVAELASLIGLKDTDHADLGTKSITLWPESIGKTHIAELLKSFPATHEVTDARKSAIRSMLETELAQAKAGTPYLTEDEIPF